MRTEKLDLPSQHGNSNAPPALNGYGGNVQRFVKDTETHFGGDFAGLYSHAASQPIAEQKALFNHSKRLQDYLGISEHPHPADLVHSSPLRFRETTVSSGPTQRFLYRPQSDTGDPLALRIHYSSAPAALAKAVTLSNDDAMIERSLARLEAVLQTNTLKQVGRYWDGPEYRKSIGLAGSALLDCLGDLKNESHQRKVLELFVPLYTQLDPSAQADIRHAARKALSSSEVSGTLKTDLERLATGAVDVKPQQASSAAEPEKPKDVSSGNEVADIAGPQPEYSPITLKTWPMYPPHFEPLVLCTEYARQAAERLISEDGKLDRTHIPRMLDELRKETRLNEDYQQYAIRTLENLGNSDQLKSIVDSVCEETLLKRDAADLIRATLHMPYDAPVTEVEARKAVVMGLLAYFRQDDTGTCFAASVAVCLLDNSQEQVASDMKQLLETQKLQFRANDAVIEVPLNMKINRADTQSPCRTDVAQASDDTATYEYFDGPGMQAALTTLGIPEQDRKSLVNNGVKKLLEAGVELTSVSSEALIKQIVYDVLGAGPSKRALTAALNAFTMTETVGLTNAWTMTLASGADILRNRQDLLNRKILYGPPIPGRPELQPLASLMQSFEQSLQSAGESEKARNHAIAQDMLDCIQAQMRKHFCVQYDPSFRSDDSPDAMRGAFILHRRAPDPSQWQRIDNSAAYQAAVVGLIENAYVEVREKLAGPDVSRPDRNLNEAALRQITQTLVEYVRKEEFLRYVVGQMNPSADDLDMPFKTYEELPWQQLRGSSSVMLGESYGAKRFCSPNLDENSGTLPKTELRDMAPAMNFLCDSLKKMRPELQAKAAASHQDFKIVVAAGNHAFALMPMHMKEAWEDENSSAERWIEETMKKPAMQYISEKRTRPALITLVTEAAKTLGVNAIDIYTKVAEKSQTPFRDGAQSYTLGHLYEALEACECPYRNRDQLLATVEAQLMEKVPAPPPIAIGDYIWADQENGNAGYLQVRYNPFKDRLVGEVKAKDGNGFGITGRGLGGVWEVSTPYEVPG